MDMRTWRDSRSRADDATRVLREALAVLGLPERVQRNLRPMVTHSGTPFVHMGMVKAEHVERMTPPHVSRTADTEWQDVWSQRRRGLEKKQEELAEFERASTEFRYFLPSMVTGLLATPEYVRASLAHIPGDHGKAIAKKLERQARLRDTAKRFTFILTEQAVRWPILPPPAMALQVDRLLSISLLPNVRLGVIPLAGHMPRAPLNTFTVYDTKMATAETRSGAMLFRDSRDVSAYLDEFAVYESYALFGEEWRRQLSEWAGAFGS